MNLDLARRFLLEFLPEEAHAPVHDVFEGLVKNPFLVLNNGMIVTEMKHLKDDNKLVVTAAANGMITGLALAHCMERAEICKHMEMYLEEASKRKGENVINFLNRKKV